MLVEAERQLEAYFKGDLLAFDLPLEPQGTDFQQRCWLALASIPYGQTASYGEQRAGWGSAPTLPVPSALRMDGIRCPSSCLAIA